MTRQRRAILDELRRLRTHPTADELYARVRRRLPRVSLGTVYRNLEILAAGGGIGTLQLAGKQMRFDGNRDAHDHVRCLGCGRIDDVPPSSTGRAAERIRKELDYDVTGRRLEFIGYCPKCRRRRPRGHNGG
jgi:Fur family ferric uptake transcriptional regulator